MEKLTIIMAILFLLAGCSKDENQDEIVKFNNTCPPWNDLSWVKTYAKNNNGDWVDIAYAYPDMTDKITIEIKDNIAHLWRSYHTDADYASNPDRNYYFQSINYSEDLSSTSELVGQITMSEEKTTSGYSFEFDIYNLTLSEKEDLSDLGANIKLTDGICIYYMKDNTIGNNKCYTSSANAPIVTTSLSESVGTGAILIGNAKNDAGFSISSKGMCWSLNSNPTISDNKTNDGNSLGIYSSKIEGLQTNSTYYIRAYATNTNGDTGYGNEISITTDKYAIGQELQGGVVAYILQPGDPGYIDGEIHGLIAASSDHGFLKGANNTTDGPNSTETGYGTGSYNTNSIVWSQSYGDYAAKYCKDLELNGYDDWFLPSKDELNLLFINKDAIGGFNTEDYIFYWTSSVRNRSEAWVQSFSWGYQKYETRTTGGRVRPVRYF